IPAGSSESEIVSATASAAVPAARLALQRESSVVLVADGDVRMARYLRANLEAQRYRVVVARDLEDIYRHIDLEEPDLLLLDSTLPGLETSEALQRLGSYASAPLILLAPHADPLTCARALDLGVADYVAKPFSVEELLARLRAALRKREGQSRASSHETTFTSGELQIDFSLHQVMVNGKVVQLSKTEFKLLRTLAQHAGMVLAHEVLLERVWGPGYGREVDFVWVYIRRLRRKIEPNPSQPRYILTVPGIGYRLARI
ncbi:MAG TPA: response regulator transcription factor, partial [Ktedonobacterales bacterium]|nr:response regulator transcription factor [Ktedonobacterales bacterium]